MSQRQTPQADRHVCLGCENSHNTCWLLSAVWDAGIQGCVSVLQPHNPLCVVPLSLCLAGCRLLRLLCTGSSTACVLVVNGTTLSASNLGDSGFVLVRDGVATFQCPQQQHNFNFPFQLGSADSMSDQPQAAMVSWAVNDAHDFSALSLSCWGPEDGFSLIVSTHPVSIVYRGCIAVAFVGVGHATQSGTGGAA